MLGRRSVRLLLHLLRIVTLAACSITVGLLLAYIFTLLVPLRCTVPNMTVVKFVRFNSERSHIWLAPFVDVVIRWHCVIGPNGMFHIVTSLIFTERCKWVWCKCFNYIIIKSYNYKLFVMPVHKGRCVVTSGSGANVIII